MTREEHTAKIREIKEKIKDLDDGTISESLAELSLDYGTTLSQIDTITLERDKFKNDNENLRDTNMRLFLKVGDSVMNDKNTNSTQNGTSDNKEEIVPFEELFNEKGELI